MKPLFGAFSIVCAGAVICGSLSASAQTSAKIAPRVLVVATHETGKDTGDTPGQLQFWAEREKLSEEVLVPGIEHPLLTNGKGLYAMVSGVTSRSALSLMSLAAAFLQECPAIPSPMHYSGWGRVADTSRIPTWARIAFETPSRAGIL